MSSTDSVKVRTTSFAHPPLDDASKQMRLFKFVPGNDAEPIRTILSIWDMNEAPEYIAISYVWGSEWPKKAIRVNDCYLAVSKNCWRALHKMRRREREQYLWIDALCVNQLNVAEKSLQVRAMGQIFSQARMVWAVLESGGSAVSEEERSLLFEKLQQMEDYYPHGMGEAKRTTFSLRGSVFPEDGPIRWRWVQHDAEYTWKPFRDMQPLDDHDIRFKQLSVDEWKRICRALIAFGTTRYWRRIWTVQEIVVSEDLKLLYKGTVWQDHLINALYLELEYHFEAWANHAVASRAAQQGDGQEPPHPEDMAIVRDLQPLLGEVRALAMMRTMNEKYNGVTDITSSRGQWDVRSQTPITVLHDYQSSECFDPRDRVFAMERLTWSSSDIGKPRADYNMTLLDLTLELMKWGGGDHHSDPWSLMISTSTLCQVFSLCRTSPEIVELQGRVKGRSHEPPSSEETSKQTWHPKTLTLRERENFLLHVCPERPIRKSVIRRSGPTKGSRPYEPVVTELYFGSEGED